MVTSECKNCKQQLMAGIINEYGEHFCDSSCYEKYCRKNGYDVNYNEVDNFNNLGTHHTEE